MLVLRQSRAAISPRPTLPRLKRAVVAKKIQYTSRFVRVILAQGPC